VKIKEAGFDYIRLSHYPHSPAFMDACDELGLVTMDSILGWQFNPGTPAFVANRLAAARALIRRDRNHPSAVFWEVSLNETQMKPDFIAALHAAAHEEFPGDQMFTAGWVKGYDVKVTARQHHSTKEFLHATFPCIVSEYGDWEYYAQNAGLAQEKWQNLNKAERSSRQLRGDGEVRLLQQATNLQEAHNENRSTQALADGYWVMFDYNRGYAADVESSGIMDLFRLPKFSYFFFQSQRDAAEKFGNTAGGPMVHIATWWTPASPLSVRVFSNGDEVELFLNGRSLGRRSPDKDRLSEHLAHPPFTFTVEKFEPGELKAVAYLNGNYAAEHTVKTPGEAKRLELVLDISSRPLAADGDLVFVYARVVDEAGTVAPNSAASVNFQVKGPAELIGQNPIAAEAGIATILLKTRPGAGKIQIEATSGPLKGAISL
jgi:beta-galactosidase